MSIYIITHKKCKIPNLDGYKSLLVGAYKGHVFGDLYDDTGDNISEKNPNYCELTGLYWIWKNTSDKYVGLVHYRRYFSKSFRKIIISEKDLLDKLNKYDIVVPERVYLKQTLSDQFKNSFTQTELDLIEESISKNFPEYIPAYKNMMQGHLIYFCNMLVCKKELLDAYCDWLFTILFDIEKHVDMTNYNSYQKRLYGFISERLLTLWILYNNLKICEIGIINTQVNDKKIKAGLKGIRRVISYHFPSINLVNKYLENR